MLRHLLLALAAVFGALALAILVLPYLVSSDKIRADLTEQLARSTGYRIDFGGNVALRGIPALRFTSDSVTLTATDPGAAVPEIAADQVGLQVDLLSLLGGKVRFNEIVLDGPVLTAGGGTSGGGGGAAGSGEMEPVDMAGVLEYLDRLQIDKLSIRNGLLRLADKDGAVSEIGITAFDVSLPSIASKANVSAQLERDGQTYDIAATIDTPRRLLNGEAADVEAKIGAPGILSGEMTVSATATMSQTSVALADLKVSGDAAALDGSLDVDWSGIVPRLTGSLGGDKLAISTADAAPSGKPAGGGGASGKEPLDLTALAAADVDLSVSVDRISVDSYTLSPFVGHVQTSGGFLDLTVDALGFAGGQMLGHLTLDPAGGTNKARGRFEANGIDLATLRDMAGLAYGVTGEFGANIDFVANGATLDELRRRANAAGQVFVSKASVSGLGLAAVVGDQAADTVDAIGLVAEFAALTAPVSVKGGASWRGERFDLAANVDAGALIAGKAAPAKLTLNSKRVGLGYNGTVAGGGKLKGAFSLKTPSLRGLLAWLNQPLGPGGGLEQFAFSGGLAVTPQVVVFTDAKIALDGTSGTGHGRVKLGPVPTIEATLALGTLDINPYLASGGASGGGGAGGGGASGWSDAPIDLAGLKAVDATLNMTTKSLVYKDVKTGPVKLRTTLSGGVLTSDLDSITLYGGQGLGRVVVDGSGPTPALALQFDLAKLNARPFLTDLAKFRRIEGKAAFALDVRTAGNSQKAMAGGMNGQASMRFSNGAIRGINLAQMMRSLTTGTILGWQLADKEATDFSELSASFQIADGVARNSDLKMIGPLVRVTGAGAVDLPGQTLDFRVDPKLVASLQGQGTAGEEAGFGVPIRVSGPWARPNIYPDIAGILQNPEAAYQQLRQLGGGMFGNLGKAGSVESAIEKATGVDVGTIVKDGKIDRDAAVGAAVDQIGRILGGKPAAQQKPAQQAPQADTGAPVSLDPNAQPPAAEPEPQQQDNGLDKAARSVLRNLLGGN